MAQDTKTTVHVSCLTCRKEYAFSVFQEDFTKYLNGAFVQDAFPYLSEADRELFISRTCGPCFDEMFGEDDDFFNDDESE